jgi:RNA polymerase sigma-70 factor (ECF subfamily)
MIKAHRFRFLIKQHKDWIYTYAYYFTGDRAEADDITQEAMIRLWQHLDAIQLGSARRWIKKTVRNLCIDSARRRRRITADSDGLDEHPGSLIDPMDRAHDSLLADHIARALTRLPEKHRSVLIMREILDMSYRDISNTLQIPLNSVRVFLWRARSALRETLKKELKDAEI